MEDPHPWCPRPRRVLGDPLEGTSARSSSSVLLILALALGLLGVVGIPGLFPPPKELRSLGAPIMSVRPGSTVSACPLGAFGPFGSEETTNPSTIWSTTGLGVRNELLNQLVVGAPESAHLELPFGFILAAQNDDELLGSSTTGCFASFTDQWVILEATQLGSDTILILSNPSPPPSGVMINAMGTADPLAAQVQPLIVPTRSSLPMFPLGWFTDEDNLILRIQAEGTGVAALTQFFTSDGKVSQRVT